MADFYPVLARGVSRLPHNNVEARYELYAWARAIVAGQVQGSAAQAQQAALEAAIARIEGESRVKATADSLAKILQVLQVDEPRAGASANRPAANAITAPPVSAVSEAVEAGHSGGANTVADLGRMPNSLGAMLFGIAYAAAAIAFTGVTYIRAIVWVEQGVIGYPMLVTVMATTIGVFLILPAIVRRSPGWLAKGRLPRLIYSGSRHAP